MWSGRGFSQSSAAAVITLCKRVPVWKAQHLWQPMSRTRPGEIIRVYSLPLLAYRAMEWVSPAQVNALFSATRSVYGVFHLTIRPSVLTDHSSADALMRMIGTVRYNGYEWLTAHELARWLTAARQPALQTRRTSVGKCNWLCSLRKR